MKRPVPRSLAPLALAGSLALLLAACDGPAVPDLGASDDALAGPIAISFDTLGTARFDAERLDAERLDAERSERSAPLPPDFARLVGQFLGGGVRYAFDTRPANASLFLTSFDAADDGLTATVGCFGYVLWTPNLQPGETPIYALECEGSASVDATNRVVLDLQMTENAPRRYPGPTARPPNETSFPVRLRSAGGENVLIGTEPVGIFVRAAR